MRPPPRPPPGRGSKKVNARVLVGLLRFAQGSSAKSWEVMCPGTLVLWTAWGMAVRRLVKEALGRAKKAVPVSARPFGKLSGSECWVEPDAFCLAADCAFGYHPFIEEWVERKGPAGYTNLDRREACSE